MADLMFTGAIAPKLEIELYLTVAVFSGICRPRPSDRRLSDYHQSAYDYYDEQE
jgi:hypothetical protein